MSDFLAVVLAVSASFRHFSLGGLFLLLLRARGRQYFATEGPLKKEGKKGKGERREPQKPLKLALKKEASPSDPHE